MPLRPYGPTLRTSKGLRRGSGRRSKSLIYAPLGSPTFQEFFGAEMRSVGKATSEALGDNLASLWLGGGFGRGEGAVTHASGTERAHNDVDTFLFVNDASKVDHKRLKELEHEYSERLGAEFEYSHPIEIGSISRMRPALMWFDVLNGHEVLAETTDVAALFPAELSTHIPPFEGPRLLLNRAAGLIWALRVHRQLEPSPDPDFVRRNLWKARLGLIEAALIVEGRYIFGIDAKNSAYATLAAQHADVLCGELFTPEAAARAYAFKVNPDAESSKGEEIEDFAPRWEAAFRAIEGMRFGHVFVDAKAYEDFARSREPMALKDRMVNFARNAKAGRIGTEHPREPLYRCLPALLGRRGPNWSQDSERFLHDWRKFC